MELYFSSAAFLWALPLAGLPVLFHVRARAKQRAVTFPGAFFLQDPALPSAERRRRIEDLLLLALRSLLLVLAALMLAGPRLRGLPEPATAPTDPSSGSEAVVLVLDDSPSLALRMQGENLMERVVRDLSESFGSGVRRRIAIEAASGGGLPFTEAQGMRGRLHEWTSALARGAARSGSRAQALARAVRLLQEVTEDRKVVVLVTDLGCNEDEGREAALEASWFAALEMFTAPTAPILLVAEVAALPDAQWTVESILPWVPGLGSRPPVAGQPFSVKVRVRCLAGAGTRRLRVESLSGAAGVADPFSADRAAHPQAPVPLLERAVSLDAGQSEELEVPALAPAPGPLCFRACFEEQDEFSFDDQATVVVQVQEKSEVYLWDLRLIPGESMPPLDVARQAFSSALDPLAGSSASRVNLRVFSAPRIEELKPRALLAALHGPQGPRLSQEHSERLRGLIHAGLHVLWLPDLSGKAALESGARRASDPLLPRDIERVEERAGRPGAEKTPAPWRLGLNAAEHPLLAPFAGGRNGDLAGVRFQRRLALDLVKENRPGWLAPSGSGLGEEVLARFDDGFPAIVFKRLGDGGILQLGFGVEAQGGIIESAAWPVLAAGIVAMASADGLGSSPEFSLSPGESSRAPWPVAPRASLRRLALSGPWICSGPRPAEAEKAPSKISRWELDLPAQAERLLLPVLSIPGSYRVQLQGGPQPAVERWVSCRIAPVESSLTRLPEQIRERISKVAAASGGGWLKVVASGESGAKVFAEAFKRLRPGKLLAPWLWPLFAVAMAMELGVLIARRRSG